MFVLFYGRIVQKHRIKKRGKGKLEKLGIPEEELLRQQQQLFEEARQQQLEVRFGLCVCLTRVNGAHLLE